MVNTSNTSNTKKRKPVYRIIVFGVLFYFCLEYMGYIFQAIYGKRDYEGRGVSGIQGFYDIPKNTIETIVVGTSVAGNAVNTPMLYEEYGICAYNLSVSWQPVLASYFWTKEAYHNHSETLKTVIMEVGALTHTEEETKSYKASIDNMRLSKVKLEAISAYTENLNDTIENLIPLFSYHNRWNGNLDKLDMVLGSKYEPLNVLGSQVQNCV